MKLLRWFTVLAVGLLLPWIASVAPRGVEVLYSRSFFPGVAGVLGRISGSIRFSLAQVLVVAGAGLLVFFIVRGISVSIRRRSLRKGFGPGSRWVAVAAIGVWTFHLAWGLNYARAPLQERLPLEAVEPTPESLARLTRTLAAEVNRTYGWAVEGRQVGIVPASNGAGPDRTELAVGVEVVADRLAAAYAFLQPRYAGVGISRPKLPPFASWILTRVGISGFYFPFTGEATVNRFMPDASIPFTMAHEMAHQRGTAREDEANFLAYLACRESGLAAARYSGALAAFGIAYGALWRAAPDSVHALGASLLDAGPRADRVAIRAFWQSHKTPAADVAHTMNDAYLKANAQRAGTASYSRAVRLLVALESAGGIPEED